MGLSSGWNLGMNIACCSKRTILLNFVLFVSKIIVVWQFLSFPPLQVCVYSLPSPLAPFASLWGDHLEESWTEEHYWSTTKKVPPYWGFSARLDIHLMSYKGILIICHEFWPSQMQRYYHMMTSYIKGSRTAGNKVTTGSNHLSPPNTSIYGFKAGLQPIFPPHLSYIASNECTKAAGKHRTQTQHLFLKIVTESRLVEKLS